MIEEDGEDDVRLAAMLRHGWRRAQVAMARALAENGLSGVEYHLLLAVSAAGETGIRQVDVAQELNVPEARISVLAHQLRQRRLVEALRSEPDRRYVRLRLRPEGGQLLKAAMRSQRATLVEVVSEFPEDAVVRMLDFLIRRYLGLDLTLHQV
jgi:DNA-binding MarR family transcriptional regulator